MWSISDIFDYLGASAEFDRTSYAIRFNRASVQNSPSFQPTPTLSELAYSTFAAPAKTTPDIVDEATLENISATSDRDEANTLPLPLDLAADIPSVANDFEVEEQAAQHSVDHAETQSVETTADAGTRCVARRAGY